MKKLIVTIVAVLMVIGTFAACAPANTQPSGSPSEAPAVSSEAPGASAAPSPSETTSAASVSGSVTAVGSSALQPLAQKAADLFMVKNPDAKIQVQGGGSGTGLNQIASGACDIGNSDLFAEEKLPADQASALVDHKVCVVGFATVANPKVTVTNLTNQQLVDIFTGKVTNWKDVGGNDMKIIIINRPASSGTRATFKKYALNGADEATGVALTEDSSGTVKQTVASTDGAVSYLAFSYLDNTVKSLQLNGVDPTAANVESGKYLIWSYEHMYTKGEAAGATKAFLDYMMSDEFKSSITELGYIPNADMQVSR